MLFAIGCLLLPAVGWALSIQSVTPNAAPPGGLVTIQGEGFGEFPTNNLVSFGTIRAVVTTAASNTLTVRVPLGANIRPITVTRDGKVAMSPLPFVPSFFAQAAVTSNIFSAPIALPSLATPHGILGDVDGDGWLDVVFANYHSGSMSLLRNVAAQSNLSAATFPARLDIPTGSGPHPPAMGDIDGDGKADIVVPNDFSASVWVFRNTSSPGSLAASSIAPPASVTTRNNPVSVRPVDIDGDGKLDLVVANAAVGPSTVSVHRNVSSPGQITAASFEPGIHFPSGRHSFRVDAGDLNGDGKPDVVVANLAEGIVDVFENTSVPGVINSSSLAPSFKLPVPGHTVTVQLVDLDGDSKLDILAFSEYVTYILRNTSTGGRLGSNSFAPVQTIQTGGVDHKVADLDGDGRPDMITIAIGIREYQVHLNQSTPGDIRFGPRISAPAGGDRFDVGDLNGDGSPDFVSGNDQARGTGMFVVQNLIPTAQVDPAEPAPAIVAEPQDTIAVLGETATFIVRVFGREPLVYQWLKNGVALADATNRTLTLPPVTFADAGLYRVVVTNEFGSATSADARLTVNFPPATIRVGEVSTPAGEVTLPVHLVANGNEHSLTFSLQSSVRYVRAVLGADATGASLQINTNNQSINPSNQNSGRIGFTLAKPAGMTFPAGTQEVLRVTYLVVDPGGDAGQRPTAMPVSLVDSPIVRRVSGVAGETLSAAYQNGKITLLVSTLGAGNVATASGGSVTLPITLDSVGLENAAGFSLSFSTNILSYAGIRTGSNLPPDAAILINTNELPAGRLGISLARSAGTTFEIGLHELLQVQFDVATVLRPTNTPVRFVDSPVVRQVADISATRLAASYRTGTVAVTTIALEGDLAPRPGGDLSLSIIDWVQAGRFAAALDVVASEEFQRVDCAPRETRGNGLISVSDWVQVGRYASNLDPLTGLGGPTGPSGQGAGLFAAAGEPVQLQLTSTNVLPGSTVDIPLLVTSSGGGNAFGFGVSYDITRLGFRSVTRGSSLSNATLYLNTTQTTNGRLGFALALPAGTAVAPGTHPLLYLRFAANSSASGHTALNFSDQPVLREVSSVTASALPAIYASGDITIGPPSVPGPPINASRSGNQIALFWTTPEIGFELFGAPAPSGPWTKVAVTPIRIGDYYLVTLPPVEERAFFRLRKD